MNIKRERCGNMKIRTRFVSNSSRNSFKELERIFLDAVCQYGISMDKIKLYFGTKEC
jgi:hypothetical protein